MNPAEGLDSHQQDCIRRNDIQELVLCLHPGQFEQALAYAISKESSIIIVWLLHSRSLATAALLEDVLLRYQRRSVAWVVEKLLDYDAPLPQGALDLWQSREAESRWDLIRVGRMLIDCGEQPNEWTPEALWEYWRKHQEPVERWHAARVALWACLYMRRGMPRDAALLVLRDGQLSHRLAWRAWDSSFAKRKG